jgi:hypothetical protein
VKGWSAFWTRVQGWLHFTPPVWLGATYASVLVGIAAVLLLSRLSRSSR